MYGSQHLQRKGLLQPCIVFVTGNPWVTHVDPYLHLHETHTHAHGYGYLQVRVWVPVCLYVPCHRGTYVCVQVWACAPCRCMCMWGCTVWVCMRVWVHRAV